MIEYKKSEKQNYIDMLRGEMPEFLPRYKIGEYITRPSFIMPAYGQAKSVDMYGVTYVTEDSAGGGALPEPGNFILKDIRDWRDVIKHVDLNTINWEECARKDMANSDFNKPRLAYAHRGFFQSLMAFMGFTEGMCAMAEEPEEVIALFDYICNFAEEILKNEIMYYKIDGFTFSDDTAAAGYPFMSLDMYHELIKPFEMRLAAIAKDNDLPIHVHNCGKCEQFIEDWMELGISGWDPAQVTNDLMGIKKKYGRKLVMNGCWDQQGRISLLDTPDDELRDALVEYVDTFAPGGAFGYVPYVLGSFSDPRVIRKNKLFDDFYEDYAKPWYHNHPNSN